jgi:hypothetical protein
MTRFFNTIDPPAAISFYTPTGVQFGYSIAATNVRSDVSLVDSRIRSAFESAGRELRRYERYPAQWDGYRAQPFAPEVLENATAILAYSQGVFLNAGIVPQLVTTGPASDGSIDVELQVEDRRVLVTLYPQQGSLSSFDLEGVHEHVAELGEQTLETWVSWLHQPNAVPNAVDQNPAHPR